MTERIIERKLAELSELRSGWRPPVGDAAWLRRAWAAWSNAGIEGNPLSWPRARVLLARNETAAGGRVTRELHGCLEALEFIDALPADLEIWTPSLPRQLHAILMRGLGRDPGALRAGEVKIVRESGRMAGETVFAPPHPGRVPELLEELLAETRRELRAGCDVFLLSGRFHYEFQSIHPFEDGNGRAGRLLSTLIARRGWSSAGFHLAPAVARAGAGYYLALRAVRADYESSARDGLNPWLLPYFDMLEDALRNPDPDKEPS